jgi:hypothetical protein
MSFIRHSKSEEDTIKIGRELADIIIEQAAKSPMLPCITLSGNLGMGKSILARSIIRHLCGDEKMDVPSPTYTIVQNYELAPHNHVPLYHYDLYRLESPEDLFDLGFDDARFEGITLIEWPEKAIDYLPKDALKIMIESDPQDKNARIIKSRDIDE